MARVKACSADAIEVGGAIQVDIEDKDPIAIYRLEDGYYATDDICTHGAAYLSEGEVEGGEIYCPFHAGAFDIRSGEATATPCVIPLKTYPVSVENGEVFIDV